MTVYFAILIKRDDLVLRLYLTVYVLKTVLINRLRIKISNSIINMYLQFISFFHIDMAQIVEILPRVW